MYTRKHTQWFYFRVRNMKAGATYRFTIINLMKSRSLYSLGMRPLLYSERAAKEKGVGWQRTGSNIRYYRNCKEVGELSDMSCTSQKWLYSVHCNSLVHFLVFQQLLFSPYVRIFTVNMGGSKMKYEICRE